MKLFYLLVVAAVISFTACRTKEGEPGPAGESSLNQQGSISGTITYTDNNGTTATIPFNYQYFESLEDNRFYYDEDDGAISYGLQVERRTINDANNYYSFTLEGSGDDGILNSRDQMYANFSFYTVINNQLYKFDNNDISITNVSIDSTTGRVTFDFAGSVKYNNNQDAAITGKVDVILNRSREYI